MTVTDISAFQVAGLVMSALVGTGAVAFFVRYGTRLALLERLIDTSQLVSLHPRLTLVESAVQEIKTALLDLKHLPKISNQLDNLAHVMQAMVPRTEHEARWKNDDTRLHKLEDEVSALKNR